MRLAHHFPGIAAKPHEFIDSWGQVTPEQLAALEEAAAPILKGEHDVRLAHTKSIMQAAAGRRLF